ncbi:NAD-dependent epimerase/dehydratase family protein, partial [Salmonella enterica]|uniref:NAD-dependent epimerase/dehydratase family protein n=1 Tax=Salmonella enterica TaxID=28901 RepID=UPI003D2890F9
ADGRLGQTGIDRLSLVDVVEPGIPVTPIAVAARAADLSAPGIPAQLVVGRPDVIFHLAAIVSGEAEADFDKGYRINLDGTRALFEAIRQEGMKAPYRP